ncbi:MAG: recombinase family protein [Syntrophorhabdus sp.]
MIKTLYGQSMRLTDTCKILKGHGILTRKAKDFTPEQVKRIINGHRG